MALQAYCRYSNRTLARRSGGRIDATEVWVVPGITNTKNINTNYQNNWQYEAMHAVGLPSVGDIWQDGGLCCSGISPRSLDDQGTAYVDVRWQEDPLTLVTEVHYFSGAKTKPAWKGLKYAPGNAPDGTGTDIRNSAGDRFNPPVTYEAPQERIEITFRRSLMWHSQGIHAGTQVPGPPVLSVYGGHWENYIKRWNKTSFTIIENDSDNILNNSLRIFPPGSLMLWDKRAPLVKEPYFHRLITLTFIFDPDLWGQRVPDMGPRCFQHLAPSGSLVAYPNSTTGPVTDAYGHPLGGPAELDGTGKQLIPVAGVMPSATIYQWWPCDDSGKMFNAEFSDLDLFTPERKAKFI